MAADLGFKDSRNKAELLLAPKEPLKRENINASSLKLNLGGASLPGFISSAAQITGPLRKVFSASFGVKALLSSLATSITGVLGNFDKSATALKSGTFIPPDPLTKVTSNALPTATDFVTFSGLRPGQTPPAAFSKIIDQRKTQLQRLAQSFASVFTSPKLGGVTITENTNPTTYPHADQKDKPSVPRLALGGAAAQADPILQDKTRFVVQGVQIGTGKPSFWSRLLSATGVATALNLNPVVNQLFKDRKNSGTWSEPPTRYAAQYPYNKVQQSESGHVIEIDDTPGAERVHVFHRSGSFIEWHPDGTVVYKNMKDAYDITMNDKFVKVNGKCHMAVDGGATLYVKGNIDIQSEGDINVQTKGDFNVYAKNINMKAKTGFTADGTFIDLRYIKLPFGITPVFAGFAPIGFAPKINLAALASDFPSFDPNSVPSGPNMDPHSGGLVTVPARDAVDVPAENPLTNWGIYQPQTPAAITYRARLFDTPEEVNDLTLFTAHQGLQQALGDTTPDQSQQLGGSLRTAATGLVGPTTKPTINYLNFDDFKGNYTYANTFVLGATSFTLADLSDLALHPDVAQDILTDSWIEGVPADGNTLLGGGHSPTPPGDTTGGGDPGNFTDPNQDNQQA
jgi:hypothetical protein